MSIKSILILAVVALCPWMVRAEKPTVYFNGDILTMESGSARYVEAVVVKGEEITFAGDAEKARSEAGEEPEMHDLQGHTLLPGFIDTWGHFTLSAQDIPKRCSATARSRWPIWMRLFVISPCSSKTFPRSPAWLIPPD
jgi:hypothetical protein